MVIVLSWFFNDFPMIFQGGSWPALIWVCAFSGRNTGSFWHRKVLRLCLRSRPVFGSICLILSSYRPASPFHSAFWVCVAPAALSLAPTALSLATTVLCVTLIWRGRDENFRNLKNYSAELTLFRINRQRKNDAFGVALSFARWRFRGFGFIVAEYFFEVTRFGSYNNNSKTARAKKKKKKVVRSAQPGLLPRGPFSGFGRRCCVPRGQAGDSDPLSIVGGSGAARDPRQFPRVVDA